MEFTQEEKDWLESLLSKVSFSVASVDQGLLAKSILQKISQPPVEEAPTAAEAS